MCVTWLRSEPTASSITVNDFRICRVWAATSPANRPVAGSTLAVPSDRYVFANLGDVTVGTDRCRRVQRRERLYPGFHFVPRFLIS
jgi:hypothetical protein